MLDYFSCFRSSSSSSSARDLDHPSISPLPNSMLIEATTNPTTTSVYYTDLGVATVTWSLSRRHRTVDLSFHEYNQDDPFFSFRLFLNPLRFFKKQGSKKLHLNDDSSNTSRKVQVFWDLRRAKFLSAPEPRSGYYIAVLVDGELALVLGDSEKEAYAKCKVRANNKRPPFQSQALVLRREHVFGSKFYEAKARFGGEIKDVLINCGVDDDDESVLDFILDGKKLLRVKRLEWKFRGNERVEIDGVRIDVAWDVYNWLFKDAIDKPAIFSFKFSQTGQDDEVLWQQVSGSPETDDSKKKKTTTTTTTMLKRKSSCETRSSSSSSFCSWVSSASNSSVAEWGSLEDSELQTGRTEFTLMVFAWKLID